MKIGFIGAGNMACAMIGGLIKSKLLLPESIWASAKHESTLKNVKDEFKINTSLDSKFIVKTCNIIIIAVKPQKCDDVLREILPCLNKEKILISVAAGKTIMDIEAITGSDKKIIRAMPNTPALVNEAMSAICPNKNIDPVDLKVVKNIFDAFGRSRIITEDLIHAVIGISGSSPAYAFMFIEAMADCAVSYGMPRDIAYEFAAQALLGSAKMVLETKKHPGELKDMVCSPNGTTIEAVKSFEMGGLRKAVIEGMSAAIEKSKSMTKEK